MFSEKDQKANILGKYFRQRSLVVFFSLFFFYFFLNYPLKMLKIIVSSQDIGQTWPLAYSLLFSGLGA